MSHGPALRTESTCNDPYLQIVGALEQALIAPGQAPEFGSSHVSGGADAGDGLVPAFNNAKVPTDQGMVHCARSRKTFDLCQRNKGEQRVYGCSAPLPRI